MKYYSLLLMLIMLCGQSCGQTNPATKIANGPKAGDIKVGGSCEGCEAIYESPVSFTELNEVDTLPDFNEAGPKLVIAGTVYKQDGKTPAGNVILYIYHTDQAGNYSTKGNDREGWGKRHGYIRGWIKTNEKGSYTFYTLVPASYPNSNNPKHIHPTVKEPGKTEYWIDEFVFADDPLLSQSERERKNPVGGNGVLKTVMKDDILYATRDIILGLNVKDYPANH
ncbi:MAG TPA: hypothetical protein VF487_07935 [Chitinophagaceae bacterium]